MRADLESRTLPTVDQLTQTPEQAPARVLVVEDTADIRDLLKEILAYEGYDVTTAEDGLQALARLSQCHFDLVLTDLMMPGMHGLDLLDHLTEQDAPPIIAMSAFERFRDEAASHGASAFLGKPVDIDVLLAEVHRVIIESRIPH